MSAQVGGSACVCFDTTALIHFNAIGQLDTLGEWFPRAYAPVVVIEEEIRAQLAQHPSNQAILDAQWLQSVEVSEPSDLETVANIHRRYGRTPGQDRGEAEVVVLCARNGWTAIMDDTQGQRAAADHNATYCSILTMILIASAHGLLHPGDAWKLHGELEQSRGGAYSALTAQAVHKPAFHACIERFGKIGRARGDAWPHLLGHPGVEGVVRRTRGEM